MLHDIGTAVDYDDHHKHSRYLVLNAGLPGFTPREIALIGQMTRYHRKGNPSLGEFEPVARDGDEGMLARCSAVLRLAEQLERPRDQTVQGTEVAVHDGTVELRLRSEEDVTVARWAAARRRAVRARVRARAQRRGVTVPLYTNGFADRPAYAEALTHALLLQANDGELEEAVRVCVPGRLVSFGKLDAFAPGFAAAVAAAERAGFAAVHRVGGGRAAVFHEGTILFSHVVRDEDPRPAHARPLPPAGGRDARGAARARRRGRRASGPCRGEYCPGDYSLGSGRTKLVGIAQRIVRHAACTQGVLVVTGGDLVRSVLEPVYEAMELDWDPETAGDLGGVAIDDALAALRAAFEKRLPLEEATLDRATLARAQELEPAHDASVPPPRWAGDRAGEGARLVVVRPGRPDRADLDELALAGDRLDDLLFLGLALAAVGLGVAGHAHAAGLHRLVADHDEAADHVAVLPTEALDVEPRQVDLGGPCRPTGSRRCRGPPWPRTRGACSWPTRRCSRPRV
jgi:lipoate-protein ligase A